MLSKKYFSTKLNSIISNPLQAFNLIKRQIKLKEEAKSYKSFNISSPKSSFGFVDGFPIPTDEENNRLKNIKVFTSSGVWTRPSWCKKVVVELVGGGGGGSGHSEAGGAGGYSKEMINLEGTLEKVTVTVGGGGDRVSYSNAGGNGGTSSFGSYLSATGGYGANRNVGHTGGFGGNGSGGNLNIAGGSGSSHCSTTMNGRGGKSFFGGGDTVHYGNKQGSYGTSAPGSGGCGAFGATAGGNGASGIVIVREYE